MTREEWRRSSQFENSCQLYIMQKIDSCPERWHGLWKSSMNSENHKNIRTLVSAEEIAARIAELGRQIDEEMRGEDLVVIGVLKGSFVFMADLVRAIQRPLACDFLRVSSYENDRSTGVVRLEFDLTQPVQGKNVLLIEDIVDTGRTLQYLVNHIQAKQPAQLKVASLLYKEINPEMRGVIDYLGFTIPNDYVVGYGLDSDGLYRSLPFIGVKES